MYLVIMIIEILKLHTNYKIITQIECKMSEWEAFY